MPSTTLIRPESRCPQGAPVARRYGVNSYEFYLQDVWKVKPNFTLTLGLRYSLFSPPWETNGLEVVPSLNLSQWFNTRAQDQLNGIGSYADPAVQFQLGGAANGKAGYYNWDYKNFAPRLAFAWSPKYHRRPPERPVRRWQELYPRRRKHGLRPRGRKSR